MGLLLYAGGFTTSIEAGMAFLDWPLSNGSLNPEGWTQASDQLAEHSHRLLGMKMGLLSLLLLVLSQLFESRRSVRLTAWILFGVIVLQGLLGGLRVMLDQQNLNSSSNAIAQVFLILHACGAQFTLCTMVTLVLLLSKGWIESDFRVSKDRASSLRMWSKWAIFALVVQLLLGAFIRHFKAAAIFGNAFPLLTRDFVGLTSLIPSFWNLQSTVHYFHRIWAVVLCVVLMVFYVKTWAIPGLKRTFKFWLLAPTVLLATQIFLGALVVWTLRNPYAATIHTITGASILAITWGLTFYLHVHTKGGNADAG